MKTIRSRDIAYLPLSELKPGMIATEGVILAVDPKFHLMYTAQGPLMVDVGQLTPILGKLGPEETAMAIEAANQANAERRVAGR